MSNKIMRLSLLTTFYLAISLYGASPMEKQQPAFIVRTASSMEKIFRDSIKQEWLKKGIDDEISISACRNESESFQIVVIPFRELKNLRWEVTSDFGGGNIRIQPVGYVDVNKSTTPRYVQNYPKEEIREGLWPDPLFTYSKLEKVSANELQPLWVTIDIPKTLAPGKHKFTIKLMAENANTAEVTVNLQVWDFELSDITTLKTSFWFSTDDFSAYYYLPKDSVWETEKKFLKKALDSRITPIDVGMHTRIDVSYDPKTKVYSFDFTRFKQYLDFIFNENEKKGNQVNILTHPFIGEVTWPVKIKGTNTWKHIKFKQQTKEAEDFLTQYLMACKTFLKKNGWYKNAYMGFVDEPVKEHWENIKWMYRIVKKVLPDIPTVSALSSYKPSINGLKDYLDIMVPGYFSIFTPESLTIFQQLQRNGKELWGYVCFKTSCIDYESIDHRILIWQCWKYNLKGFLYWGIVNWDTYMPRPGYKAKLKRFLRKNPQERWPYKAKWEHALFDESRAGDGYLLYPSPEGEPWSSIRLENIRDGIEDYEYFSILKRNTEKLKKLKSHTKLVDECEKLLKIGPAIIQKPGDYSRDYKKLLEKRIELGNMIQKTSKVLQERE